MIDRGWLRLPETRLKHCVERGRCFPGFHGLQRGYFGGTVEAYESIHRKFSFLMAGILLLGFLCLSACDNRLAGAVGTGNSGRIFGKVVSNGVSPFSGLTVRLISVGATDAIVDTTTCDSSGTFQFGPESAGNYRVEVWKNGILAGKSGTFVVDGDVSGILVVLIQGVFQRELDLSSLGNVDSVYVDYPQNPGVQVGSLWLVQTTRDSGFVIHVHIAGSPGRWEEWVVVQQNGKTVFVDPLTSKSMNFQIQADTGAFLLTPHTVALWNFDSLLPGNRIPDRSPYGNDLTSTAPMSLVPSPHGKALVQASSVSPVVSHGDSLVPGLRWNRTGTMTYEMRLRLDSIPLKGMILMGSYAGITIWATSGGQIAVTEQLLQTPDTLWSAVVTDVGKVPVGRWFDLAVGVDGPDDQIYVWIDETAQAVYARNDWPSDATLLLNPVGDFGVGGYPEDPRPSYFQIDEARISDTLVYGRGYARLPSTGLDIQSHASEAVEILGGAQGNSVCSTCSTVVIGLDQTTGNLGYLAWKPSLPASLLGTRIVSASITAWTSTYALVPTTHTYLIYSILAPWSPSDPAPSWFQPGTHLLNARVAPAPLGAAPLKAESTGGADFDVTSLVQEWVDDTTTNHGILLGAVDPTVAGDLFAGAGTSQSGAPSPRILTLSIRYQ